MMRLSAPRNHLLLALLILVVVGDVWCVRNNATLHGFGDWIFNLFGVTTTTPRPRPTPASKLCDECTCTLSQNERIVGGSPLSPSLVPWLGYVTHQSQFLCAGTLISQRYLLTAAHPLNIARVETLKVSFAGPDSNVTRRIAKIHRHPMFDYSYDNDVALLKLDRNVDETIKPICLYPRTNLAGMTGYVVGWGSNQEYGDYPTTLNQISVPIWTAERCRISYANRITANMFCAGEEQGGKDACKGDSGGPLLVQIGSTWRLIGIVSWGFGCGEPHFPGVYTNASNYLEWMRGTLQDACFCYA